MHNSLTPIHAVLNMLLTPMLQLLDSVEVIETRSALAEVSAAPQLQLFSVRLQAMLNFFTHGSSFSCSGVTVKVLGPFHLCRYQVGHSGLFL